MFKEKSSLNTRGHVYINTHRQADKHAYTYANTKQTHIFTHIPTQITTQNKQTLNTTSPHTMPIHQDIKKIYRLQQKKQDIRLTAIRVSHYLP